MNKSEARNFLKHHATNFWLALKECSLDELEALLQVAKGYSITNCWYVEYEMKDAFINTIQDQITNLKIASNENKHSM